MQISNTKYHLTVAKLRACDTTIEDSYNRTEYLKQVLKEVYGNDYSRIIDDIKICLGNELLEKKDIGNFFKIMES